MTPTHILAYTLKQRDTVYGRDTDQVTDYWTVGTEDECRQQFADYLKNPDLYCAAVSRIEASTDWGTSPNLLEAVAVAWETVLGIDPAPECIENEGTYVIRLAVVSLAPALSEAYYLSPESARGACFDWDFAPRFFRDCVEWSPAGPILRPDWRERAAQAPQEAPARARSASYNLPHYSPAVPRSFDALEVHTVIEEDREGGTVCEALTSGDEIPEGSRVTFSLYGHTPGEGVECIGDFTSFDAACDFATRLGGV